ncbi:MAG: PaaI family thioesterase [Firmicutes bacterium]|nr:PaaI family thioesterase [Bacillota bacterium]
MKFKVVSKQHNTDMCFICGMNNNTGTKAEFYNCIDPDGNPCLVTKITPREEHQSYPGRMHGGIISALLDEAVGRAVQHTNPEIWGVTIDLAVKFRKPVPLDKTVWIVSRVTNLGLRSFDATGEMFTEYGTTLASVTAKYFKLSQDQVFNGDKLNDKNWFIVPEKLPKYFEL